MNFREVGGKSASLGLWKRGRRSEDRLARTKNAEGKANSNEDLDAELLGCNLVVAIKFQIVEGSGNAKPARCGSGFDADDASFAADDHVAAAHRAADQDNFEFDGGGDSELPGAEEKDAGGADVASDQGDRKIFGAARHAAKAKREAERRSGIFALLVEDADGVGGDASKAAQGAERLEGHDAERRNARGASEWSGGRCAECGDGDWSECCGFGSGGVRLLP